MFDRLLVPTDGSGPAAAALELAARIASETATVHVLHVSEPSADGDAGSDGVLEQTPEEILTDARGSIATAGTSVLTAVREGAPREQILEYVDAHDIEIVSIGSHGRRETESLVLGSVTEGIVRDAPVPVLVVRASDDIRHVYPYKRILVPTDGSDHANVALKQGIETAAEMEATLHLLSVVTVTRYGTDPETDRLVEHLEENARAVLETAAAKAAAKGVDVHTAVEVGSTYGEISRYAETNGIDLLVMGTHGRTGADRELLGSVTERVLRTAPAPVLTVRPPETNDT